MPLSRRSFLQLSSLASASLFVPKFLQAFVPGPDKPRAAPNGKILVVLQLSGGNDGLNTVIPVRNDLYFRERPKLALPRAETLALDDETALHPALKTVKALYDAGEATIINGVGYPDPDRSHFRSMDIWQTASGSRDVWSTGWLGRYLDRTGPDGTAAAVRAIELDDSLSLAMKGAARKALALRDARQYHTAARDAYVAAAERGHQQEHDSELASYLHKTLRETLSSADYLFEHTKTFTPAVRYPDSALGKRLQTVATLINSDAATTVYYVSHGSFDTHVNQREQQHKLFGQLDEGLAAFTADLKAADRFKDVLILSFSEFGRRVAQNASGGTDHGTAGPVFLLGGGLKKPGLATPIPALDRLDQGDLRYTVDFRSIYAGVLDRWLETDAAVILGRRFEAYPGAF
jgi:uncharacterized protein (DUF1501 family)